MTGTTEGRPTRQAADSAFARARHETVRYHEEFYASAAVGQPGTWMEEPDQLMVDALERLPQRGTVTAYDLGAGIGRHTLPMLSRLPAGSEVYAVDLLQSALDRISSATVPQDGTTLHTVQSDLADFTFQTAADLIIVFSAIEHLPDEGAIRVLLERIRAALNPGGVVAAGIIADRFEVREDGTPRAALLESGLSAATAADLLADVFGAFSVDYLRSNLAEVDEERDGERYTLRSTLVTFLAKKHQ
ncbi:class I SAM-dependent methyltransferase [Flexivirga alba]|uniref:Class I SAM-dependent methyltransferase n=1 Tax=Flexivirga alba TaxID=702742 RepID=A0ABW2AJN6_9MICO